MTTDSHGRGGRPSQKTLQLCAQAADALAFALGDTTDPVLLDLTLVRVEPMPDQRHLLVVVDSPPRHGLVATLEALDRARGFLRTAVAASIHRSKAPRLSFTVEPRFDPDDGFDNDGGAM
ncbi:MAG: hypothetical protein NXI31_10895 [bacterium]|nr:hypothetical protein [bacterium]